MNAARSLPKTTTDRDRHTQKRQPVIKTSPALIEALMRDSEPLELIWEQPLAVPAQEPIQGIVQLLGVLVYRPLRATGVLRDVWGEGGLHSLGRVGPSW